MTDLAVLNERLREVGTAMYGGKVELRVVDPKSVVLLKKNARFMEKSTFDQLVANVTADGVLESVPLCHTLEDGRLECISGNHRIQAAIKAEVKQVLVFVFPRELPRSEKISRQLSHNAITGKDDLAILAELWKDIATLEQRLYAGLDSATIGELEKIKFSGFSAEPIRTEQMTLWFLPEEVEDIDKLLDSLQGAVKDVRMVPLASYEALWKAIVATKKLTGIKNTAVAFMLLIDKLSQVTEQGGELTGSTEVPTSAGGSTPQPRSKKE